MPNYNDNEPYFHHIAQAHDHFFRLALSDKAIAKSFLMAHLPKALAALIDFDQLALQSGSYIDDLRQESIADVLFQATIQGYKGYLYLLIDHQSKPDKLMPFRILKYTCNVIDKYLKESDGKKIPFVFPLVVYHGKQVWKYSTDIRDLIDAPKKLIDEYFLHPFSLIDLNSIEDKILKDHAIAGIMELTLKHIFAKNMQPYAEEIIHLLKYWAVPEKNYFAEATLGYILDRGQLSNLEGFLKLVKVELSEEIGEKVMNAAEQLIQKGIQQGMQQGAEQERKEIIRRLYANGLSAQNIVDITGFDIQEIKALKSAH